MMPNPMMGGGANIMQMVQRLKSNPMQFIMQRRLSLPQSVNVNDPNAILNYLVQSGQIDQNRINQAYQMANSLGRR